MHHQGHIDLSPYGDWFLSLCYPGREDRYSGLEPIDDQDRQRYLHNLNAAIHVGLGSDFEAQLCQQFSWLTGHEFAITKLSPGDILPLHRDLYRSYRSRHDVTVDQIQRIIVFLQDWQSGHLLQIGDQMIVHWQSGDWVSWIGHDAHLAANLGPHDRYTLQITGAIQ